ncbi:tryptophan--tRNA ligase [soil metagenome]
MIPRVFSGIQPTGDKHIGNYLGAIRRWVERQDDQETYLCVVDLHALTLPWDPRRLHEQSLKTAATLLACGIDPERSVLFVQSHVPAHAELAWVLTCIARMGELRRMVQYKEKAGSQGESVGAGLLTYPVLQAADVLLYGADGVPVGEDQRQHIELMRTLAVRFNSRFGETFVVPEAWIAQGGARIMALDDPTEKMSTSAARPGSKLLLIDEPDVVARKIRSAVTDSGREVVAGEEKPALSNLLAIFSALDGSSIRDLEERFRGNGYGAFKQALAEAVIEALAPIRERYARLMEDVTETQRLLALGAARAEEVAEVTMKAVRERTGLGDRPGHSERIPPPAGEGR